MHTLVSTPDPVTSKAARFLLPSITDLIFILLLIAFTYGTLSSRLLWDGDIGWHIRDGQNIIAAHAIPHADAFSATMGGKPWYAWEWLYDLGMGWIYSHLGLNGVVFFSGLVIALTFALVFRFSVLRGGTVTTIMVLLLTSIVASSIHFLARPHVISWLITVGWFSVLDSSYRGNGPRGYRIWWLPFVMLLWANLHGGFVLGFVLLGVFLAADFLKRLKCRDAGQRRRASRHARHLGVVFGVSALASLINPYGYKLHVHVYQYLTNRFLMQHIDEFRRPNIHGLPMQFFLLLLVLTLVGILAARAKLGWAEWLVILFSSGSGLYAARNIPVAAMLLTMIAAPLFSRASVGSWGPFSRLRAFSSRMDNLEIELRWHAWPILAVLLTTASCFHQGTLFGTPVMNAHFDATRFPVQAVDWLEQRGNREPVFTLDSWGGYLIYRLYPGTKVFVDDRHDFYGEPFVRDYLQLLHVEPGWNQVLDQLGVNLIVVPAKSKLGDRLQQAPGWKPIHQDEVANIFERSRGRFPGAKYRDPWLRVDIGSLRAISAYRC